MSISLGLVPMELQFRVLSFCDDKTLRTAQSLSKEWEVLACDNLLWKNLFTRCFQEEVPTPNNCKEAFRKRACPILINESPFELRRAIKSFFCGLKWNTKREFICLLSNQNYCLLKIQQGFGPNRGTAEGFKDPADEVDYYEYMSIIDFPILAGEETFRKFEKPTQCPGYRKKVDTGNHLPVEGQPIPLFESVVHAPLRILRSESFGVENLLCEEDDEPFVNGKIDNIDIGDGNTLGYFSEVNDWKSPFTLFCTQGNAGQPIWAGRIPFYSDFLFVSINSKGEVKYEQGVKGYRRIYAKSQDDVKGHDALKSNLENHPIRFS